MKHFLIVVDMQKDFVDGALGTPEAVKIVPEVVRAIESFNGTVFATFDTHFENYMATSEGHHLPVPHCIKGTPGWELDKAVAMALDKKGFTAVEKLTFGSVDLPGMVKASAAGEDFDITLLGLCTDICVVSNALLLKATFPEVPITVKKSCCAGVSVASHEAALTTMAMCQIAVVD